MPEDHVQTVLVVEDSLPQAIMYEEQLKRLGYNVVTESEGKAALKRVHEGSPAAILLDLHLLDMDGVDVLREARRTIPHVPVIVMTVDNTPEAARMVAQEGAADFLHKPFSGDRLGVTLRKAIESATLEKEVREFRLTFHQKGYHGFIGQSPSMQAVYRIIDSVAASKASVFITGESGTGKELAAQALHQASPRRSHPFMAINCGAIPHDLMESTLFGHVKGAFTSAVSDHVGAAKKADGGTVFLDEVAELPPDLQVKLLRFLQTGEITPVGSNQRDTVDVRIVAATNRRPLEEVKAGRLREDLYYRLHVVPLELPALRDREDDIVLLAMHFLKKFSEEEGKTFSAFSPEVIQAFRRYDWPGNVRQLENVVRTAVVLNEGVRITEKMLPENLQQTGKADVEPTRHVTPVSFSASSETSIKPLWLVEKEAVLQALEVTHQDVAKAAAMLEVSPSTLYRKLQTWKTMV